MWTIRLWREDEQERLHAIWSEAVRATHGFISEEHFRLFSGIVRDEMLRQGGLWVAADGEDRAIAWMQIEGRKVEALFVDPAFHRRGAGRALMDHARRMSPVLELDANEQSGAVAFYRRLGFVETGRSEADGRGLPYPLVHMRLGG
ncbi:MAG TPA: acetyltransferase [Allosphingosinicella sp.]|jgi:putative acetyltransferase